MLKVLSRLCCVLFLTQNYAVGEILDSEKCRESCPPGEEDKKEIFGDHCYYWSTAMKNWKGAEFHCQAMDGHLAAVTSLEIHNFLMKRVDKDIWDTEFWIGGTDKEKEGTWKWVDGSLWNFTHWASEPVQQPNRVTANDDCLQIYHPHATNGWNDLACVYKRQFICSWKLCSGCGVVTDCI